MTNLRSLSDLFRAAMRLAAAGAFASAMAVGAAGQTQTNEFPLSGNAGVGTTTPTLQSGTTNTMIEVKGTVNPGVGLTSTAAGGRQFFVYSSQANPGYFSVFDATAGADRFVINNLGNVGIGTASPAARLDINTTADWASGIRLASTSHAGTGIRLTNTDTGGKDYAMISTGSGNGGGAGNFGIYQNGAPDYYFYIKNGGNVGIGTASPQSTLQIGSLTSSATGSPTTLSLGGSYSSLAGANLKLKLYDDSVADNTYGIGVSSGSMDFGVSPSAGYHWYAGGVNKMTLTSTGDLSVSGAIAAKYQDLAEWVPSSEQLSAATVVVLDATRSNEVIASTQAYDTRVAGVISAQPGITLGESGEGKVLVATTGRVKVKVDASRGAIQIGDLLVTSDVPGVAMKSEPVEFAGRKMHMPGTIIGKALEPLAKGSGEILVLLSLQ